MERTTLEAYRDGEGLHRVVKDGGFLQNFMLKTRDSLEISRLDSKIAGRRSLIDMDLKLPDDKPIELPHCEGVSFHIGALKNKLKGGIAGVNLRVAHNPVSGSTVATMQGDISLLLPRVGLIPVGTLPPQFTFVGRPRLTLSPDAAGLFSNYSQFHISLGSSLLVVDDSSDDLRVAPAVNVHGRIFRIGNTGVLVGFETMAFRCSGGKPHLDLTGGRIWQQDGA